MVEAYKPNNLKEALELLAFNDCIIFAGGTDLMVKGKRWPGLAPSFEKPVMFISQLQELREVTEDNGILTIGAACTLSELVDNELIPEHFKTVFRQMASPGIRNIATIGGNICNASPAGDSLPLLYALDAEVVLQSSCRKVELPIAEFIQGVGKTILKPGEMLTAIKVPKSSFNTITYRKVGTRKSTALSKLSFIGLAASDKEGLQDVRLAFGAVAPTVVRSRDAEEDIIDMLKLGSLDISQIIDDYSILIKPINDQRSTALYRKKACIRLLVDFIINSLAREGIR